MTLGSPSYFKPTHTLFDDQPTQHSNTPTLQHSNTPTLQYSNTPIFQYSIPPFLEYADTPTRRHVRLPCNGQIAIEFGPLRLTENADPSVMCLNDLASD
jgi:hypothetical protein